MTKHHEPKLKGSERYYRIIENVLKNHAQDWYDELNLWDWPAIKKEARALGLQHDYLGGHEDPYFCTYIGTVFILMPSGKYYMPWATSNITMKEAAHDEIFYEVLEDVAEKYGGYITSGEGSPTDLYFCFEA